MSYQAYCLTLPTYPPDWLHRMSQNQGALPPAAGGAALGQHGHGGAAGAGPHSGPGQGGPAPGAVPGAAGSAADVEARVALELRAGRAEQELSALRHQVGLRRVECRGVCVCVLENENETRVCVCVWLCG